VKLVIRPHRPLRRASIITAVGIVLIAAVWFAFDLGGWKTVARAWVASDGERGVLDEIARLGDENSDLRYELKRSQRALEVNRVAHHDSHVELVELQSQIDELERELAFYRDVLGAAESEMGPRVKGLQIRPLGEERRFAYRLVLIHLDENDRAAEGSLRIGLQGRLMGSDKTLGFSEVVDSGPEQLVFKFKHFRMFEGTWRLPEGFEPRRIKVAVQSRIPPGGSSETYDWAAVLN